LLQKRQRPASVVLPVQSRLWWVAEGAGCLVVAMMEQGARCWPWSVALSHACTTRC